MKAGLAAALQSALLLATVSLAGAQQPVSSPPPLRPAPAALSVPNPLEGVNPGPRDLYRSPDGSDRFQHSAPYPAPPPPKIIPGFYLPVPYYVAYEHTPKYRHAAPRHDVLLGRLVLETIPDHAQVYVDGFYVGLAEEFGLRGRALDLRAGPHHMELRAPDYETATFSVMIEPNGILRYRGDMRLLSSPAPPPRLVRQPVVPTSVYVIPNCYAGNKPPTGTLPKGCSLKNLRTRK